MAVFTVHDTDGFILALNFTASSWEHAIDLARPIVLDDIIAQLKNESRIVPYETIFCLGGDPAKCMLKYTVLDDVTGTEVYMDYIVEKQQQTQEG